MRDGLLVQAVSISRFTAWRRKPDRVMPCSLAKWSIHSKSIFRHGEVHADGHAVRMRAPADA
jgi:hypothetical protein